MNMFRKLSEIRFLRRGVVGRNALWNLAGSCIPLTVAAVAVPQLIHHLGAAKFGFLSIVWVVIGYFGLFDFGLGRALTNLVARSIGAGRQKEIPPLVCTALILMLTMGVIGGLTLVILAAPLVHRILNVPLEMQAESLRSLWAVSVCIPVAIVTTGFRGIVEAHQRFDLTNLIRIPQGIFNFAGPLLVVQFSSSLFPIVLVLVAGRIATMVAFGILTYRLLPKVHRGALIETAMVRPLISFGGWMTVSSIVSPVMASLDRFLIGSLMTMQAVAFYSTPSEVATKLLFIPAALAGVLFPTFSTLVVADRSKANFLFFHALKYLAVVLLLPVVAIEILAHVGLKIWLGPLFATHSAVALRILAVGVLANGLASLPFALIQGSGRPSWTGKLHLIELPLYLALFYPMVRWAGVNGAAMAWTIRMTADSFVLFLMARHLMRSSGRARLEWESERPIKTQKLITT